MQGRKPTSAISRLMSKVSRVDGPLETQCWIAGYAPNQIVARTNHCRKGHPLARRPNGTRVCRTCKNAAERRYYWEARA